MEKFINLPAEKQNTIIDAALISFGTNGYKKTSVSDIAAAAGISKAMVFHYFGTKKALYFYLFDLCRNIVVNEVNEKFDDNIADFFDRIKLSANIEISVMKKHPAILSFIKSAYFENDEEVSTDIKAILIKGEGEDFRKKIALDGVDSSKFKDGIDLELLTKMLTWMAEGFASNFSVQAADDFETICTEFYECMDIIKNNFYKEEYL